MEELVEACRVMLRAVGGGDRAAAERAARSLKKVVKVEEEDGRSALWVLRKEVFRQARRVEDVRVRWNLVIVLGRLEWKGREKAAVVDWLLERLGDESALTRTFAMQALWDLSDGEGAGDAKLRARVTGVVRRFAGSGTAAIQARARRLLAEVG